MKVRKLRVQNPAPMFPFVAGTACGVLLSFIVTGTPRQLAKAFEIHDVPGAILLFRPSGLVGQVTDVVSGNVGFSHTAIYVGLQDEDGEPIVVDAQPGSGVHAHKLSTFEGRETVVIPLTKEETRYARRRALSYLERRIPYRGAAGGISCTEFVLACLPAAYRKHLDGFSSPNDLARAYGVDGEDAKPLAVRKLAAKLLR